MLIEKMNVFICLNTIIASQINCTYETQYIEDNLPYETKNLIKTDKNKLENFRNNNHKMDSQDFINYQNKLENHQSNNFLDQFKKEIYINDLKKQITYYEFKWNQWIRNIKNIQELCTTLQNLVHKLKLKKEKEKKINGALLTLNGILNRIYKIKNSEYECNLSTFKSKIEKCHMNSKILNYLIKCPLKHVAENILLYKQDIQFSDCSDEILNYISISNNLCYLLSNLKDNEISQINNDMLKHSQEVLKLIGESS